MIDEIEVLFAYNPVGEWTNQHQIRINGKTTKITDNDLIALASEVNIKKPEAIIKEIRNIISQWPDYAKEADISDETIKEINKYIDRGRNQPVKSKINLKNKKYETALDDEEINR